MSAFKDLDLNLQQLAISEAQVFEFGTIIGKVGHIHDEYEPKNKAEELYISALVRAEIFAENIVNIISPDIEDDDTYWHAIVNVREYMRDTEPHQISIEGLQEVIMEAV